MKEYTFSMYSLVEVLIMAFTFVSIGLLFVNFSWIELIISIIGIDFGADIQVVWDKGGFWNN